MDPETKKLLENTYKLTEENNRMLHKVRGVQKRAAILSAAYWFLIIGAAIGAFYFLQPYIDKSQQFLKGISSVVDTLKNVPSKK